MHLFRGQYQNRAIMLDIKTLLCITVLVMVTSAYDKEFKITWHLNDTEVLTYPYSDTGDCLYDVTSDVTKCMIVRPFKTIKQTWRYKSGTIRYLSVRCQEQENYHRHQHVCICKNADDAANPGQSQQHDLHYYCHISKLSNRMFSKLVNLEVLDLSDNLISNIEGDALDSVTSLKYLDLSRNPLSGLSGSFLCDAKNLEILIMEEVHFKTFPEHIFDCGVPMEKLKYIDLSDNIIASISSSTFKHIPNVISLDLSSNNFSHFLPNAFQGASKLISLDLSENDLKTFPDALCRNMPMLEYLLLAENQFTELNMTIVSECASLRYLNVSVNNIKELKRSVGNTSQIETILFRRNMLRTVPGSGFLGSATSLTTLDLSYNIIREIGSGAFRGLEALRVLDLSNNLLNDSSNLESLLQPLKSLSTLDLSVNQFLHVQSGSFMALDGLQRLNLSMNKIVILEEKAFDGLGQLKVLDLRLNQLKSLHPDLISKLSSLMLLDLSFNAILSLDGIMLPASLIKVNIMNNRLTQFPNSFSESKVQIIDLGRNEIDVLNNDTFTNISSLRNLDLSHNRLNSIEEGSFRHLSTLKLLNLSHNELSLNLSKDIFNGLTSLTCLDLSFNKINKLEGIQSFSSLVSLEHLNISGNEMSSIIDILPDEIRTNNSNLVSLDLSNSEVEYVGSKAFNGFSKLHQVDLSGNSITSFQPFQTVTKIKFVLQNNPLICGCEMKWIKSRSLASNSYLLPDCMVFPLNASRPVKSVPSNLFLCSQPDRCPDQCSCYSSEPMGNVVTTECSSGLQLVPAGIPKSTITLFLTKNNFTTLTFGVSNAPEFMTEVMYLNNSGIKYVDDKFFAHFTKLRRLYMDKNDLLKIKPGMFQSLLNLEELYLQHNRLVDFRVDILTNLNSLKVLDLRNNDIWHLAKEICEKFDSMNNLGRVYLGHNSWKCNCNNLDFRMWIVKRRSIVYDRYDVKCGNNELRYVREEYFVCRGGPASPYHIDRKQIIITSVVVIVVLAILLTAFLYYRRDILAALHSRFKWGCFRHKYPDHKIYDVFLVYDYNDSKSAEWVDSSLLPRLQRNCAYKVVIPDQTKLAEGDMDTEITKIYDSKCCVFVLTKYVTSNRYCSEGFKTAFRFSKTNKEFNFVMVVMGDIDISILEPGMRKILSTGNYITVRSRSVWDRLYYELPNPRGLSLPFREDDDASETDIIIYRSSATNIASEDYGTVVMNK